MRRDCILCGVGGQGTVLASKLIAQAALQKGIAVHTAETIGMAQRGGSVMSHVRMGEGVYAPLIAKGQADLIIGFEPGEAVRCLTYLKKTGTVLCVQGGIRPVTDSLGEGAYDGQDMCAFLKENGPRHLLLNEAELGTARVLNVALLGAAAESGLLGFSISDFEAAITEKLPEAYWDMNRKALHAGAAAARKEQQR